MRKIAITVIGAGMVWLLWIAQAGDAGLKVSSAGLTTTTNGFFHGKKSFSASELQARAVAEIRWRGHEPIQSGECVINFVLDPDPACLVILSEGFGKRFQRVTFDRKANMAEVYIGIAQEGPPSKRVKP